MDIVTEPWESGDPRLRGHTVGAAKYSFLVLPLQHDLERRIVSIGVFPGVEVDDPGIPHHRLLDERHLLESLAADLGQELGLRLLGGHRTVQHGGHGRRVTGHRGEGHMEQSVPSQQAVAERLEPVRGDQLVRPGTVQLGTLHALHVHAVKLEDAHRTVRQNQLVLGESARDRVVDLGGGALTQFPRVCFVLGGEVLPDEALLVLDRGGLGRLKAPDFGKVALDHELDDPLGRTLRLPGTVPSQIPLLDHPHRELLPQPRPLRVGTHPGGGLMSVAEWVGLLHPDPLLPRGDVGRELVLGEDPLPLTHAGGNAAILAAADQLDKRVNGVGSLEHFRS